MAHGDAREGKWRGKRRMEWVASTLHTTSEHGVSSSTTADAHTSAASSRLNWRPRRFKLTRTFRRKTKSGFCACSITFQTQFSTAAMVIPWLGNGAFPLCCWRTYVAVNNITNTLRLYMKTQKGVLSIVVLFMSLPTRNTLNGVLVWNVRHLIFQIVFVHPTVNAPMVHITKHYFPISVSALVGAIFQGVSLFNYFRPPKLSVNTWPNALAKRGLVIYALFSRLYEDHCDE